MLYLPGFENPYVPLSPTPPSHFLREMDHSSQSMEIPDDLSAGDVGAHGRALLL